MPNTLAISPFDLSSPQILFWGADHDFVFDNTDTLAAEPHSAKTAS
jgi:hypothetical protein